MMSLLHIQTHELVKILAASVAPVFLITGIAAIISAMSLRYGRVIDRTRTLLREGPKLYGMALGSEHMDAEIKSLHKRARLLRFMIILEIASAAFVVLTIVSIFISLAVDLSIGIIPLAFFLSSLGCLLAGLFSFIQDFYLSLQVLEHDMRVRANIDVNSD